MFKLNIPVTKSYSNKKTNTLTIEGIASDSSIDRDSERFSDSAVEGMHKSVNEGNIPIKIEHGDNIFSEVGVWKEATMTEDGKVFVKGDLDLDLSMSKDIQVLLNKGMEIALSVGGSVLDAITEYNDELGKSIKVYTDIILKEISIVKNPANFNATLSLAKSYNVEKKAETEEAIKLDKSNDSLVKASDDLIKSVDEVETLIKTSITKSNSIFIKGVGELVKGEYEDGSYGEPIYESYEMSKLDYLDYKIIGNIYRIYSIIGTDEIAEPMGLGWEAEMELPEYSFIPLASDPRAIPYMDKNLKVRKDWIIYGMCRLAKGEFSWISATERSYAMEFLYSAHKQLLSAEKSVSENSRDIRADEVVLMEKCIDYKVNKKIRPQYEGNDLSDTEISKLAKAYSILLDRNILKINSNNTMRTKEELELLIKSYNEELAALEVAKTEAPVVEDPVVPEVVVDTTVAEAPVIEKEEAPVVVEEAPVAEDTDAKTTEKKTSIDEALLSAIATAVETANKSTADSIIALEKSMNEKIEAIKTANETSLTKSVNAEKENSATIEKMATVIAGLSKSVEVIGAAPASRQSFATDIQKGYLNKTAGKTQEELIVAEMEKNGGNLADARIAVKSKEL